MDQTQTAPATETVVVERLINASPETLFEYWTDAEKISQWLTVSAELDPQAGGIAKLVMSKHDDEDGSEGDFYTEGRYLVVEPHSHLEFTWGFEREEVGVPPGSSVVSVDFLPQGDATIVRVSHSGLRIGRNPAYSEDKGWNTMLDHLKDLFS